MISTDSDDNLAEEVYFFIAPTSWWHFIAWLSFLHFAFYNVIHGAL